MDDSRPRKEDVKEGRGGGGAPNGAPCRTPPTVEAPTAAESRGGDELTRVAADAEEAAMPPCAGVAAGKSRVRGVRDDNRLRVAAAVVWMAAEVDAAVPVAAATGGAN